MVVIRWLAGACAIVGVAQFLRQAAVEEEALLAAERHLGLTSEDFAARSVWTEAERAQRVGGVVLADVSG